MPRGDDTKTLAFALWRKGKTVQEIQREIGNASEPKPTSVRGWIVDWERGCQRIWTPALRD